MSYGRLWIIQWRPKVYVGLGGGGGEGGGGCKRLTSPETRVMHRKSAKLGSTSDV